MEPVVVIEGGRVGYNLTWEEIVTHIPSDVLETATLKAKHEALTQFVLVQSEQVNHKEPQ